MAQLLVAAPFYVRAARSGFDSVDRKSEAVAFTLGASRTRTFFRIVVPQIKPALFAGIVLCWARSMGELGATLIFAGNFEGKTQTMPLAIIQAFEGSSLGLAGAIALSVVLLIVALGVLVLFRMATAREPWRAWSISFEARMNLGAFGYEASFDAANGIVVLFGHSGAGKSVTLQMIAGLMRPSSGTVKIGGRAVFDSAARNQPFAAGTKHFGYEFQELSLFPHMTVAKNVEFGVPAGTDKAKRSPGVA